MPYDVFPDRDKPRSVIWFPNGTAAVCDGMGRQMPRYQRGWHGTTIKRLKADGYDWREFGDVMGSPLSVPPAWWTPEREARELED